jgi:glycosyltransferase involved in cell wall biosynthesis
MESFFGGSHGEFAKGLVESSRYDIDLITMPERNWRWRMRGAALYFFHTIKNLKRYEGLIVTDLMSLSDFKALAGSDCPPVLAYFHEDQITYPGVPGEDKNLFNSKMHLESFLTGIEHFAGRVPDFQPSWVYNNIAAKSDYLHPGVRFPEEISLCERDDTLPPLIIWNHRWGYDKNAKAFFTALDKALSNGLEFRLAILGDNFTVNPVEFSEAKKRYGDRIVRFGYVSERKNYIAWLKKGDIVISTALHENFGIAIVEAIRYGCLPLLPNRLSYPEILPDIFHPDFIYENRNDMDQKLADMIVNKHAYGKKRQELSDSMGRFAWKNMITEYDKEFENLF